MIGRLYAVLLFCALPVSNIYLPVAQRRQGDGKGADLRAVSKLPSKEKRWALLIG